MSPRLRIGVVGVGRIGTMHAELLARRIGGAELTVVCDTLPEQAERIAADLGAQTADNPQELLARDNVDAVAICSGTDTHVGLIVAAAEAGKAIFCEKPIALDLAEVDRALAAVEEAGVPLHIGFNRRFDPGHRSVREAVRSGRIGDVELVRISSRDPAPPPMSYVAVSGGMMLDMTIHDFDMARYVTGSEVVEVFARGSVRVDPAFAEYGDVDTAIVTLRHADETLTVIDNSRRAAYGFDQRVEVFGSLGMAASENAPVSAGVVRTADGGHTPRLSTFFLDRYMPSYLEQWDGFVEAVREGHPTLVNGADGRAPLVLGLAAMRSMAEARPVAVSEIDAVASGAR